MSPWQGQFRRHCPSPLLAAMVSQFSFDGLPTVLAHLRADAPTSHRQHPRGRGAPRGAVPCLALLTQVLLVRTPFLLVLALSHFLHRVLAGKVSRSTRLRRDTRRFQQAGCALYALWMKKALHVAQLVLRGLFFVGCEREAPTFLLDLERLLGQVQRHRDRLAVPHGA